MPLTRAFKSDTNVAIHLRDTRSVLVTANTADFGCVQALAIENWLTAI